VREPEPEGVKMQVRLVEADGAADGRLVWTKAASWICVTGCTLSLALRLLYLLQPWRIERGELPAFLSDEGVVGLMAMHILSGARPLFFYGQYYLGALEAYLVAPMFWAFGESLTVLRAVPTLFAISWIPLTYGIAQRLYGRRAALLSAAVVALPSPFVFEWGFKARGGFAEHVTLMLLLLWLMLKALQRVSRPLLAGLGFVAGLSIWVNQLALAYVPLFACALWSWLRPGWKQLKLLIIAAAFGIAPLIYGNVINPFCTFQALTGKVRTSVFRARLGEHRDPSYRALLEVLGAQHGLDGKWSVAGTIGTLLLVASALAGARRALLARTAAQTRYRGEILLVALVLASLVAGAGGFTGQPVGRYQLVLYPVLGLLSVGWLDQRSPVLGVAVTGILVLCQGAGIAAPGGVDGRTPRRLVVEALRQHGLQYGYGAGQVYDLIFESRESVVIVPIDQEQSHYQPYEESAAATDKVFYLYRDNQIANWPHRIFMDNLTANRVRYATMDVGYYHVLFGFQPAGSVSPQFVAEVRREIQRSRASRS
jgi:hypothetical protein